MNTATISKDLARIFYDRICNYLLSGDAYCDYKCRLRAGTDRGYSDISDTAMFCYGDGSYTDCSNKDEFIGNYICIRNSGRTFENIVYRFCNGYSLKEVSEVFAACGYFKVFPDNKNPYVGRLSDRDSYGNKVIEVSVIDFTDYLKRTGKEFTPFGFGLNEKSLMEKLDVLLDKPLVRYSLLGAFAGCIATMLYALS